MLESSVITAGNKWEQSKTIESASGTSDHFLQLCSGADTAMKYP